MARCAPASADAGVVGRLVETVDCHVGVFVQGAYRDLVGPGTLFADVFTALLTIYVALMGYQLLFGRSGLRMAELPVGVLKIGLILAFLTSWAAYQTVVYDLLFEGPRQILRILLRPMQAAGDGDVYLGLESAYQRLAEAASAYGAMASPAANILQGGPMLGSGLLWLSAIVMLLSTVGLILAAKIVLAFLLAVGPVFIGLFLFDATRGFFDGWLRTTVAFALTPLAACLFGAALVLVLEPFLVVLDAQAEEGAFEMGSIVTVAMIVVVFAIVMSMVLRVATGLAGGYASPRGRLGADERRSLVEAFRGGRSYERGQTGAAGASAAEAARTAGAEASARRAVEIADAVRAPAGAPQRLDEAYRRMPRPVRRPTTGAL